MAHRVKLFGKRVEAVHTTCLVELVMSDRLSSQLQTHQVHLCMK